MTRASDIVDSVPARGAVGKRALAQVPSSSRAPSLARADLVSKVARARLEDELVKALERRPASEARLAGALRAVLPLSAPLRAKVVDALRVLVRRRTLNRELYSGLIRGIAACGDPAAPEIVKTALAEGDAGGTATLSAACLCLAKDLGPQLSKLAASRQSHVAFAAEVARVVRGEANGTHLFALAPMIKESHRITLCAELFVPLARASTPAAPTAIGRALGVLNEAERHLGRWLVLAEVATQAGAERALADARSRAEDGPSSARSAWTLVAWALGQVAAERNGKPHGPPPAARPTVELVARLSDRPSADRDMTFLFRLARASAPGARPMLEAVVKAAPLTDEASLRAALYLARDHGREDLRAQLVAAASPAKKEELRGLAAAALWDLGMREEALAAADELVTSRLLGSVAWAVLLRAAALRGDDAPVCTEANLRWLQLGWLE